MDNRDVTLLNMLVRTIRDDPKCYRNHLDILANHGSRELRQAIKSLRCRLDTVYASGAPLRFSKTEMASIIGYTRQQDEVEGHVVAALRSAIASIGG